MTHKDIFKILLCSFGYDRDIKIDTFRTDCGTIGYEIEAENKAGDIFSECSGEGLVFNIYSILNYMKINNVDFNSNWWNVPLKYLLEDSERDSLVKQWDANDEEAQKNIEKFSQLWEWRSANHPCPTCKVNKKDHWDLIHYNCELCHTHRCDILREFEDKFDEQKNLSNIK